MLDAAHQRLQLQLTWQTQDDIFILSRDGSALVQLYSRHIEAALDRHAPKSLRASSLCVMPQVQQAGRGYMQAAWLPCSCAGAASRQVQQTMPQCLCLAAGKCSVGCTSRHRLEEHHVSCCYSLLCAEVQQDLQARSGRSWCWAACATGNLPDRACPAGVPLLLVLKWSNVPLLFTSSVRRSQSLAELTSRQPARTGWQAGSVQTSCLQPSPCTVSPVSP